MAASRVSLGEGFPSCLPIPLEHVRASDAAAAFRKRWPEATITVNAGQNFVVITRAPSSQLRTMKSFVEALDRQAPSR